MRKFLALGVLLLLLCAGQVFAQGAATPEPTPEATPQATVDVNAAPQLRTADVLKDDSLISGEPCAAPCWRGITPGKTSWTDALNIIQSDATLENVNVQPDPQSQGAVASWQQKGGSSCCQMSTLDGQTVDIIFLHTTPDVSLGQVIAAHGEPTYALGTEYSDGQSIVNLFYPDTPMIVYAFVAGTQADLSADSEIIGMLYVTPQDMQLAITSSSLYTWKGFQNYQAYSYASGNFDVTPSATEPPLP